MTVAAPSRKPRRRAPNWLGVLPFYLLAFFFLLWPAYTVIIEAFVNPEGDLTFSNIAAIATSTYAEAFATSFALSAITAAIGGVAGALLAYAIAVLKRPRFLRSALTTFSGVASQFGGVPLAFAFVATIGSAGMVTTWLLDIGIDLYGTGFSLLSFGGLVIVYLYFQIPLMVIVISPSIDGMRAEWREASESLGGSVWRYWRSVGIPVLAPPFIGGVILLFANAFAAYATAQVLTSGSVNLVPIQIGFFMQGNVIASDAQIGYALAFGMIVIVGLALVLNQWLVRRTSRWQQL